MNSALAAALKADRSASRSELVRAAATTVSANLTFASFAYVPRRSRVVQVFPSVASLERLAGAVMCDQDEAWSRSRYFSERVMSELPDEPGARRAAAPTDEQLDAFRLVARRAIEASLELADELEAA